MNIKLPQVKSYRDYHDIYEAEDNLRELLNSRRVKVKELGCDGRYWAIIYTGKRPNKDIIEKLLKKAGAGNFD